MDYAREFLLLEMFDKDGREAGHKYADRTRMLFPLGTKERAEKLGYIIEFMTCMKFSCQTIHLTAQAALDEVRKIYADEARLPRQNYVILSFGPALEAYHGYLHSRYGPCPKVTAEPRA